MSTSELVLPPFGSEKIIERPTMGRVGEFMQKVMMRFEDWSSSLNPGEEKCIQCGHDHGKGLWSGTASRINGQGNPYAFIILRCPGCDMESLYRNRHRR